MKALILNSGLGSRMGALTSEHPKCMTQIDDSETILSRQLKQLKNQGINDVVITTGLFDKVLVDYCHSLNLNMNLCFVKNDLYRTTNYIYSIYLAKDLLDDDILMLHGDLVFEDAALCAIKYHSTSCVAVSKSAKLPEKDFKIVTNNNRVIKIGTEFFENAVASQPLYMLLKHDWNIWLAKICEYCENENVSCYAETAFNEVSDKCELNAVNVFDLLCKEIDSPDDLETIKSHINILKTKTVYACFSTDVIHGGHIAIIEKAAALGKLTVGLLSDETIARYKRFPLLSFDERKHIFENIKGVENVVMQKQLSYIEILNQLKPNYVVHGDDWQNGFQMPLRQEVVETLSRNNGYLIEYPYSNGENYTALEKQAKMQLSIPDARRGRLKKMLELKGLVSAIEAHSGITGLIAENTKIMIEGKAYQFDAMWVSSLCDSTAKGKPDIELVDLSSRLRTIDDIMEVTTKPIILDGDTGGMTEHFVYAVRTLERIGVSAIIIEDKTGLKKNSLFGTDVEQTQDSIENFCEKISAGKKAKKTKEFMIIARIESLILEMGMTDALQRAFAFVQAGADGIMIHSRKKSPDEIFEFVQKFRKKDQLTPIVVVPTSFNQVTEEEFAKRGVNVVIYANQLTRSGIPAMKKTAETILKYHRAKEADDMCMSIKDILMLIPEEE